MRTSLQARMVSVVVIAFFAIAVLLSVGSMLLVRSSVLDQVSQESQRDFSNQLVEAKKVINSADSTDPVQYQQLANDVASMLQQDASPSLVGVYLWSRNAAGREIIPVSTEPSHVSLISEDMHARVNADTDGTIYYQPVTITHDTGREAPGAVVGGSISGGPMGTLELFALYSYDKQEQTLQRIQINLGLICATLSIMMGVFIWLVLRGIIRPIQSVAAVSEQLASGDLSARVTISRTDEIGTLQTSFNSMADALNQKIKALEEASASQRRFVSDVSHELRTPVSTMRMASDVLESRKDELEQPMRRTVELLSGEVTRFQDLLADLLEISRYDAGYATIDFSDISVSDSVRTTVEQLSALASSKNVPLRLRLPIYEVHLQADVRRIKRIVRNLVSNALDFAQDKPVEIDVVANNAYVVVSVRDYGVGISHENLVHIFDRFWRGDTSRARTTGGTGLGLSIAMADTWLHGGNLQVRSRLHKGTWFLLTIPIDAHEQGQNCEAPLFFEDSTSLRVRGQYPAQQAQELWYGASGREGIE